MGLLSRFRSNTPADPLGDLLQQAGDDPARRLRFYRGLLAGHLHVPGEIHDGELFIRPYTLSGRKTLLFFTIPSLASVLRDKPALVELPAETLLRASDAFDAAILNYGSRNQKEFTASEIRALLDGSIFTHHDAELPSPAILIGQPKEYPVRLMNELARALPARPQIAAAYIAQMTYEEAPEKPVMVIALATDVDDATFAKIRENVLRLAAMLDVASLDVQRLTDDALGHYFRTETKPFYEKEPSNE